LVDPYLLLIPFVALALSNRANSDTLIPLAAVATPTPAITPRHSERGAALAALGTTHQPITLQ